MQNCGADYGKHLRREDVEKAVQRMRKASSLEACDRVLEELADEIRALGESPAQAMTRFIGENQEIYSEYNLRRDVIIDRSNRATRG